MSTMQLAFIGMGVTALVILIIVWIAVGDAHGKYGGSE